MDLVELVNVLFVKQRRVFVGVFAAVLAVAILLTLLLPRQYDATATLIVGANRPVSTGSASTPLDQVLVQDYRALLDTPAVMNRAAAALGEPASALAGKVSFDITPGTYLIDIKATDGSAVRAAQIANAYATTFVTMNEGSASSQDASLLARLNREISSLALQVAQLRNSGNPRDAARALVAQNKLSVDRDTVSALTQNDTLEGKNVALATPAVTPVTPARPQPKLYLTLGAIFALLLAVAASFAANAFDTAVRDTDELEQVLGAAALAVIPRARRSSSPATHLPREPLEFLRTNLELLRDTGGDRVAVLSVASAVSGEGKSALVTEFSQLLARTGASVIAVDADIRKPRLAAYFGLGRRSPGLTDVLAGRSSVADALRQHDSGVQVLPAGSPPPNPALLFHPWRVSGMLDELRKRADYVVVDTAPILAAPETSVVAAAVDGVLLVVDVGMSKRRTIVAARDQLAKATARVVGLVLNRVAPQRGYYYAYPYELPAPNGRGEPERGRVPEGETVA
jgi:capsular exopolysaccharide synthesis family protein